MSYAVAIIGGIAALFIFFYPGKSDYLQYHRILKKLAQVLLIFAAEGIKK